MNEVLVLLERIGIALILLIGLWVLVQNPNVVKKVFGLNLLNSAVVMLFVLEGSRVGENTPILEEGIKNVVDPLPQALMLTAIVVGVCINALALALARHLADHCGSFDIQIIRDRVHDER